MELSQPSTTYAVRDPPTHTTQVGGRYIYDATQFPGGRIVFDCFRNSRTENTRYITEFVSVQEYSATFTHIFSRYVELHKYPVIRHQGVILSFSTWISLLSIVYFRPTFSTDSVSY